MEELIQAIADMQATLSGIANTPVQVDWLGGLRFRVWADQSKYLNLNRALGYLIEQQETILQPLALGEGCAEFTFAINRNR